MPIGNKIKTTRKRLGISADVLSTNLKISRSYLTLIENSKRRFPKKLTSKLAKSLKLPVEIVREWFVEQELTKIGIGPKLTSKKFQNMYDGIRDAITEIDLTGKITEINITTETMFDVKREDIIGKRFWQLDALIPRSLPDILNTFKQFAKRRRIYEVVEMTVRTGKGKRIRIESSSKLLKRGGKWRIISVVRDITDRKGKRLPKKGFKRSHLSKRV